MIEFLTGIGFLMALGVFFLGMLHRCSWYVRGLDWRLDLVGYRPNMLPGLKGGLHSLLCWLVPFGTLASRKDPLLTAASWLFHIGVLLSPLFLAGHLALLTGVLGVQLPAMPGWLSRIFTLCALAGLLLLAMRRLRVARVRALTTRRDWLLILLTAAPLCTGLAAGVSGNRHIFAAHVICGALFLVLAPFTRLAHCVLFFLTRVQLGMELAIKGKGGAAKFLPHRESK